MPDETKDTPKWQRYLKEGNLGKRLLIGFAILISFAIFIHFKEVRVEMLELDSHAKNYIVAQVDFSFPDDEGTVILRQESARDIGTIYRIDSKLIDKRLYQFEQFLIHDQRWRTLLPNTTFEELYQGADALKDLLQNLRFSDTRTLQRLQTLDLLTSDYYPLPSTFDGTTATFPEGFWDIIQKRLFKKTSEKENITYILSYFQQDQWTLNKDTSAQRNLRREVEATVPERLSQIKAGSRIVDQGEKVTQRHIAMLQAMKKALAENQKIWDPLPLLSSLIFATIITFLGAYYFRISHKQLINNIYKLMLYATIIILTLVIAKVTEFFLLRNTGGLLEVVRYPLFVPFAAILLCVLLDVEIALFSTCFLAVVLGLSLAVDHTRFIAINLISGVVAIIASRNLRKRKEVFVVCGKVWLICIPIFFVYNFSQNVFWNIFTVSDLMSTFAFLTLTSILVVGLLPILESIFRVMTDITLMEYMDPNSDLLRRLSVEAPGTYQHSLVVGSISEAAAQAIGANGLFCRVATLYHDIGKLFNPHYFTENQMGGFNIHQLLTPQESAQVIIAHVTEGVVLAKKHGLPRHFIDIIQEHHGTTLVYYFYCKQVEQLGGDVDAVDEKVFRYPGPKPRTKESAIIMMADTIEAASRSLEEVNEETITDLVNRLIGQKQEDGQFDDCQLTFEEFQTVKQTIIKNLAVARHLRIKYPERQPQ
ncbi:MAG: HDIG domain-containing protein [Chlamydiales bacterium]|nr:HDIG domain-containing protein [Chlamydiales bacterium]